MDKPKPVEKRSENVIVEISEFERDSILNGLRPDSSQQLMRAKYLDIIYNDGMQLVVKNDSGEMRKFFIDPTLPATTLNMMQKVGNRGKWMELLWKRRFLLPDNDSLTGKWVDEVEDMRMIVQPNN